ncbi:MAG: MFS transporter, partial [Myxococcales bacterium]|nr:MFS transporter [Myxococcales bacterium]
MNAENSARQNLRLYAWYLGGSSFYAWMPVFFLYFSSLVSVQQVLLLEALYYLSVVVLEVPSGYFSDRFGRKPTLTIASSALVLAYLAFGLGTSFETLAVAQILLAVGISFNSGTDTSFHLAVLESIGAADTYADREAKLASLTFVLGAAAALLGGIGAALDLRLAYLLSLAGAIVALVAALLFRPTHMPPEDGQMSLRSNLRGCIRAARMPRLTWFFGAVVVATIINHVPYEFYQPYLAQLGGGVWTDDSTPFMAGLHLALAQLAAVPVAGFSSRLARRFGTVRVVLASMLFQLASIAAMAMWISPWIAFLLIA